MAYSDYDIPLDVEIEDRVPFVTINEMQQIVKKRRSSSYIGNLRVDGELLYDEATGLFYFPFPAEGLGALYSHMIVEQCIEKFEQIDWPRTTGGYDDVVLEKMEEVYQNPLVWLEEVPSEISDKYIVEGRIAVAKSSEIRNTCMNESHIFLNMLLEDRIIWFANELPMSNHPFLTWQRQEQAPEDFILWDYITTDPWDMRFIRLDEKYEIKKGKKKKPWREYHPYFDVGTFNKNLNLIAEKCGGKRAAEIVLLLREDWDEIVERKLFGMKTMTDEEIEKFRAYLFEGIEQEIRKWTTGTTRRKKPSLVPQKLTILPDAYSEIPQPNKYTQVRIYINERQKYDEEFRNFYHTHTLRDFCSALSKLFGWHVDENSLGKNLNRNR